MLKLEADWKCLQHLMKAHFPTSPSDVVKEENIEERTVHLDIAEQGLTENMDERIYARHHIKAKKESSYPRNGMQLRFHYIYEGIQCCVASIPCFYQVCYFSLFLF